MPTPCGWGTGYQALLTSSREGACAYIDAGLDAATRQFNKSTGERATNRDRAAVTHLFDGYELVEPGVVRVAEWRPDSELEAARHAAVWAWCASSSAVRPPMECPTRWKRWIPACRSTVWAVFTRNRMEIAGKSWQEVSPQPGAS